MRKNSRKIILGMVCLCLLWQSILSCNAQDFKHVRVARINMDIYNNTDGNMDDEYLQQIADYSDIDFSYVDCESQEEALQMLQQHKIDLVGSMQWSVNNDEKYAFCREKYGMTTAEIVSLQNNECAYEDFEYLSKSEIGIVENDVYLEELKELFATQGITPKIELYKNSEELVRALESGKVEFASMNSYATEKTWKVVERYAYSGIYFVTYKGNEKLVKNIDETLLKINLYNADFDDTMISQHFKIALNDPFTKDELNLIKKKETYHIFFDDATAPLTWFDKEEHLQKGVLVDICKLLEKKTGLHFECHPYSTIDEYAGKNIVTYRTVDYEMKSKQKKEIGETDSIIDENFALFHVKGHSFDASADASYTVAIPDKRDGMYEYFATNYPNYKLVSYDTPMECIEQMRDGKMDFAFLNVYVANNMLVEKDITDVESIPTRNIQFGIALQFYNKDRALVADIVNKGIALIQNSEVQNIIMEHAINTVPEPTIGYLIKSNIHLFVIIVLTVSMLTILVIFFITYAAFMRKGKEKIEIMNQAKTDFFSRMSHDMRTPMNGILGIARLAQAENDVEVLHDDIGKIEQSGEYLLCLINDTLDLQKIESGKMTLNLQVVYSRDFIENVIDMVKTSAEEKKVKFHTIFTNTNLDCFIRIDLLRMKQILVNLLSNAIKFTPEYGTIEIEVKCEERIEKLSKMVIRVSDTGIGMSSEFIKNALFQPFMQERNDMSNYNTGSGLGLSIVKNLVKLMNGRIEVESTLGEGSTFTVFVNFERVDEKEANSNAIHKSEHAEKIIKKMKGIHVLLCEDHPLNAEIASKLLTGVGCKITWADNGEKGLSLFKNAKVSEFDVILMDIRMPVMDGIQAAREIRKFNRVDAKTVPIIAMTANAYDDDIKQVLEAGMDTYLIKPVNPQILYETISKYMK